MIKDLPIKIILVGDGPEKNNLIQYAKGLNNVEFINPIPKKKIPYLLKDANAIVLTLKNIKLLDTVFHLINFMTHMLCLNP